MSEAVFSPDDSRPAEQSFPPARIKVPRNPEADRRFMALSRKEEDALHDEGLMEAPYHVTDLGDGRTRQIFRPGNVPAQGAAFHSVTYTDKGVLVEHLIRP